MAGFVKVIIQQFLRAGVQRNVAGFIAFAVHSQVRHAAARVDVLDLQAAEFFAATLQDIGRASVYGTRTSGAGGNVVGYNYLSGPYAMGSTRVTQSIGVRSRTVSVPGLPSGPYIENLGVQPDVAADYQTRQNLLTRGAPFVAGFVTLVQGLAVP